MAKGRQLVWVGSALDDLRLFSEKVKDAMGYALYLAQLGEKHPDAKSLQGFGGAGVLEVVERYDGDAFRAVYTVKLKTAVYVLHAFQKKSKSGVATPPRDLELLRLQLAAAESIDAERARSSGETPSVTRITPRARDASTETWASLTRTRGSRRPSWPGRLHN